MARGYDGPATRAPARCPALGAALWAWRTYMSPQSRRCTRLPRPRRRRSRPLIARSGAHLAITAYAMLGVALNTLRKWVTKARDSTRELARMSERGPQAGLASRAGAARAVCRPGAARPHERVKDATTPWAMGGGCVGSQTPLADKAGKADAYCWSMRALRAARRSWAIRFDLLQPLQVKDRGLRLRGLVDLSAGGGLQAACVRPGIPAKGIDYKLPWNGNEVLVISRLLRCLPQAAMAFGAVRTTPRCMARRCRADHYHAQIYMRVLPHPRGVRWRCRGDVARPARGLASYCGGTL